MLSRQPVRSLKTVVRGAALLTNRGLHIGGRDCALPILSSGVTPAEKSMSVRVSSGVIPAETRRIASAIHCQDHSAFVVSLTWPTISGVTLAVGRRVTKLHWATKVADSVFAESEYYVQSPMPRIGLTKYERHDKIIARLRHIIDNCGSPDAWVLHQNYLVRVITTPRRSHYRVKNGKSSDNPSYSRTG